MHQQVGSPYQVSKVSERKVAARAAVDTEEKFPRLDGTLPAGRPLLRYILDDREPRTIMRVSFEEDADACCNRTMYRQAHCSKESQTYHTRNFLELTCLSRAADRAGTVDSIELDDGSSCGDLTNSGSIVVHRHVIMRREHVHLHRCKPIRSRTHRTEYGVDICNISARSRK